jgi:hypothetical protein
MYELFLMSGTTLIRRVVATAIVLIMAVWSTALCIASAEAPHVSNACCAKTHSVGTQLASPRACCAENAPNYFGFVSASFRPSTPPVTVVSQLVVAAGYEAAIAGRHRSLLDLPVKPPGRPTYLAVSGLRL